MDEVTLQVGDLLTVAGAGASALIVAQFAKVLFTLQARWVRVIAMLTGLIIVVVVTVATQTTTSIPETLLAVIVGMQAGLSASALVDASRQGLNYRVEKGHASEGGSDSEAT